MDLQNCREKCTGCRFLSTDLLPLILQCDCTESCHYGFHFLLHHSLGVLTIGESCYCGFFFRPKDKLKCEWTLNKVSSYEIGALVHKLSFLQWMYIFEWCQYYELKEKGSLLCLNVVNFGAASVLLYRLLSPQTLSTSPHWLWLLHKLLVHYFLGQILTTGHQQPIIIDL